MIANFQQLKDFLDEKVNAYNHPSFIESDPISIPHLFTLPEDIAIAGFLTATISWGQRVTILKNARKLVKWMDDDPHQFIIHSGNHDLKIFKKFIHRTMNGDDMYFFIQSLKNIYLQHGGLEKIFVDGLHQNQQSMAHAIDYVRNIFFDTKHLNRSEKHFANPLKNSSAKRICMFLRWMVRKDNNGVDFGIWKNISSSQLYVPLDLHSGATAKNLGFLTRNQYDWKAVEEITQHLRMFDSADPVKYDYALYGLGVFEKFND